LQLLNILPKHSKIQSGWPWIEETDPNVYSLDIEWPKISIVTPSFNQGAYIEETIRSVLLQNYPNLEYIIIDGGSTDNTIEIIKRYEPWIFYWVSEPDNGQSDAMNKGLKQASGKYMTFINADDIFNNNSFFTSVKILEETHFPSIVVGNIEMANINLETYGICKPCSSFVELIQLQRFKMPKNPVGYFYSKKIHDVIGDFDINEKYAMDYDFLLKAFRICNVVRIHKNLGKFRLDINSLTYRNKEKKNFYLHKKARKEVSSFSLFGGIYLWIAEKLARKINDFDKSSPSTYKSLRFKFYIKFLSLVDRHLTLLDYKIEYK